MTRAEFTQRGDGERRGIRKRDETEPQMRAFGRGRSVVHRQSIRLKQIGQREQLTRDFRDLHALIHRALAQRGVRVVLGHAALVHQ